MKYVNYNGEIVPANLPLLSASSRALKYGDGLFETIKFCEGNFVLLQEHLNRLWKGMTLLGFKVPAYFTPDFLEAELNKLLLNNQETYARVRLAILRGEGSFASPSGDKPSFIIESGALKPGNGALNENGLNLCVYGDGLKACDKISNIKHNNFLLYSLAATFAHSQNCADAIVLNTHNRVCESSIANLFVIRGNEIFTPSLQEGCVAGITRQFIIDELGKAAFKITETALTIDDILDADELFLSNSIINMRWVATLNEKHFTNENTRLIFETIRKTNPQVFC